MSTTEEEIGITSLFGGSAACDERELAFDEGVPGSSTVPNLQLVPDLNVIICEGEECVRRASAEFEASVGSAEEASERDSIVDIMGGLEKETGGESEGFTITDILYVVFRTECTWCCVHFQNRDCCWALYVRGGGCWRFDRCSHGNSIKFVASSCSVLAN